jgi:hypothetical protein
LAGWRSVLAKDFANEVFNRIRTKLETLPCVYTTSLPWPWRVITDQHCGICFDHKAPPLD